MTAPRAIDIGPSDRRDAAPVVTGTDARPPLTTLLSQAVSEGRELVKAEIDLGKAKVSQTVAHVKWAAIYLGVAVVIALSTVTALLVGLIMTLTPSVGPGWATVIVTVAALALCGLLAWLGLRQFSGGKEAKHG